MGNVIRTFSLGLCLVLAATTASANVLTVSASGPGAEGSDLAAEAIFCIVDGQLTIQLTNTSMDFTRIPSDILSGVFWDYAGGATFTPASVVLAAGSSVLFPNAGDGTDTNGEIGGEYAYRDNLSSGYGGAQYGVSANGLDAFGAGDLFPGEDLDTPVSPDGMNYGIISAGGIDPSIDSGPLSGDNPFVMNSVVFVFDFEGDLDLGDITVTGFQYGTGPEQPFIPPPPPPDIPEPATVGLMLIGLAGLGVRMRTRF